MAKKETYTFDCIARLNTDGLLRSWQQFSNTIRNTKLQSPQLVGLKKEVQDIEEGIRNFGIELQNGVKNPKQFNSLAETFKKLSKRMEDVSNQKLEINVVGGEKELNELNKEINKVKTNLNNIKNEQIRLPAGSLKNIKGTKGEEIYKKTRSDLNKAKKNSDIDYFNKIKSGVSIKGLQEQGLSQSEAKNTYAVLSPVLEQYNQKIQEQITLKQQLATLNQQYDTKQLELTEQLNASINEEAEHYKEVKQQKDLIHQGIKDQESQLQVQEQMNQKVEALTGRLKSLVSLTTLFWGLRSALTDAFHEIKELDTAFNEISVATGKSMNEMWDSFSTVNKMAQEYGVTTQGVVEVQNLYYHQGLETADVNQLTGETLTLAKIAGLDYADATDKMTAAMNAFNIAAEDANVVVDTMAALDANAAVSTDEVANALTKTASIAANAGMSIQTTSVLLTKMIETTRESSENLGTALKTVIARFTELKTAVDEDSDGVVADFNDVETALRSAGVSLKDSAGQFRDVDDVFMDLSKVWDTLDRNTQRYIATQAAGSRQQSRFIAMIEDYDRTLELTQIAQDAAGTGAEQLERSQNSLDSTLNKIKGSWQELYTTYIKSDTIRGFLEFVNKLLVQLNKLSDTGKSLTIILTGVTAAIMKPIATEGIQRFGKFLVDGWFGNEEKEGLKKRFTNLLKDGIEEPTKKFEKTWKKRQGFFNTKTLLKTGIDTNKIKKDYKSFLPQKDMVNELAGRQSAEERLKALIASGREVSPEIEKGIFAQGQSDVKKVQSVFSNVDKSALSTEQAELITKQLYNKQLEIQNGLLKDAQGNIAGLALSQEQLNALETLGIDLEQLDIKTDAIDTAGEKTKNATLLEQIGLRKINLALIKESIVTFLSNPITQVLLAIAAAITAIVVTVKLLKKAEEDAVETSEKNAKAQTEAYTNLKSTLIETRNLAQDYNEALELSKKVRTTEEEEKYQELLQGMIDTYPDLIEYVDQDTLALKDNSAALNEGSEAYQNYIETMQAEASADIASSYNPVTLAAEGNLDTSLVESNEVVEKIQTIREDTSIAYAGLLQDIKDCNDEALEEVNNLFAKLDSYGIVESNLKGALSQQSQKGFTSDVVSTLLGTDIDASQFQQILDQIHRKGKLNEKAFKKSMGWDDDQAKAMQYYYKHFKSSIDDYVNMLYDSTSDASKIAAMQAAQQIGTNVAAGFGKTLSSTMNEIVSQMVDDNGNANEDAIEDFVNQYYKNLTDIQQNSLDKIIENATDNSDEEEVKKQADIYCKWMGLSEEAIEAVNKAIEERFALLKKKKEEIKKQLLSDEAKNAVDNMSEAQVAAFSTQMSTVDEQVSSKVNKKEIENLLTSLYKDENLSDDEREAIEGLGLYDLDSIISARRELEGNDEVLEKINKAIELSGPLYEKNLGTAQTRLESINTALDNINTNLDYFSDAITGELDFSGYASLISAANGELNNTDFEIGKTGFRLKEDSIEKTKEALIAKTKSEFEDEKQTIRTAKAQIYYAMATEQATIASLEKQKTQSNDTQEKKKLQKQIEDLKKSVTDYTDYIGTLDTKFEDLNQQEEALNAASDWVTQMADQVEESALVDKLQDTADKLEEIYDLAQDIADFIEGIDIWENIDNLNDVLDLKLSNYEATIDLNINPVINEKAYIDKAKTLAQQVAAARGESQAASKQTSYWSKQIKNNKYLDINKDGNLVKNKNYYNLVASANKASSDVELENIQNQIDAIDKLATQYTDSYKRMKEADTKEKEVLKELEEFRTEAIENMADLSETLLDIMIANDEEELEDYKTTVEKKKEALDDYLDAVQDAIDKERNMRDLQNKEEDLRQKERKLSILQMDTSGLYAGDIASLQNEISDDRQSLEDTYVDNYIDDLTTKIDNQKEAYERDITRWEDYLNYKKEDMTEYQTEIENIISSGTDNIINYITTKSDEVKGMTSQQFLQFKNETTDTVNTAISQYKALNSGEVTRLINGLDTISTNTKTVDDATQTFANTAITQYDNLAGSISVVADNISSLAGEISESLVEAWKAAATEANNYYTAAIKAANAQKDLDNKNWKGMTNTSDDNKKSQTPATVYGKKTTKGTINRYTYKNGEMTLSSSKGNTTLNKEYDFVDTKKVGDKIYYQSSYGWWYDSADFSATKIESEEEKRKKKAAKYKITSQEEDPSIHTKNKIGDKGDFQKTEDYIGTQKITGIARVKELTGSTYYGLISDNWYIKLTDQEKAGKYWDIAASDVQKSRNWAVVKYKNGGYVDYTGPAWVDGTPTKPEAFLNAADTQRMEALIGVLQQLGTGIKSPTVSSNPTSNQTSNSIQVEINVDELGSEYDVEQLARDVQNTIYKNMTKGQITFLR